MSLMQEDTWTPAQGRAYALSRTNKWFAKPRVDPLADKIEAVIDPDKSALELKVRELEAKVAELVSWQEAAKADSEPLPEFELKTPLKLEKIIATVAKYYDTTVLDLKSSRRTAILAHRRQIAMYLCRYLTPRSQPEIGRHFGGRDHTTVLHAVRKIEADRLKDVALCQELVELEAILA